MFGFVVATVISCVVLGVLSSLCMGVVAAIVMLHRVLGVLSLCRECCGCCHHTMWGVMGAVITPHGSCPHHTLLVVAIDSGAWWALKGEAAMYIGKETVPGCKGGS
jgi:hypothetical protein